MGRVCFFLGGAGGGKRGLLLLFYRDTGAFCSCNRYGMHHFNWGANHVTFIFKIKLHLAPAPTTPLTPPLDHSRDS